MNFRFRHNTKTFSYSPCFQPPQARLPAHSPGSSGRRGGFQVRSARLPVRPRAQHQLTRVCLQLSGEGKMRFLRRIKKEFISLQDKPWVYAHLLGLKKKLGKENFPLLQQSFFQNHRDIVSFENLKEFFCKHGEFVTSSATCQTSVLTPKYCKKRCS